MAVHTTLYLTIRNQFRGRAIGTKGALLDTATDTSRDYCDVRLLFIRHGEVLRNLCRTLASEHDCRGPAPRGRRKAAGTAFLLARQSGLSDICAVYTTPVTRAVQTAAPLTEAIEVPLCIELPNRDYGAVEGQPWSTVLSHHNPPLAMTPDVSMAPCAEPWTQWVRRVGERIGALSEWHHGQTIVLVCYRRWSRAVSQYLTGVAASFAHVVVSAADITVRTTSTATNVIVISPPVPRFWLNDALSITRGVRRSHGRAK